ITPFLYAFKQREKIYDLVESAAGQRFHASYMRVGGVMYDVDDKWVARVREFVAGFPAAQGEINRLLTRNRIFMSRLRGVGVLTHDLAINYSCSGPIARASGVVRDLRKDEPYLAYPDFDFKVICAHGGDCYSRYMVRMQEMLESNKIIEQAIE